MISLTDLRKKSLEERSTIQKEPIGIRVAEDKDGELVLISHRSEQIKTRAQFMEAHGVDPTEYELKDYTAGVWNQMSTLNGLVDLWRVSGKLIQKPLSPTRVKCLLDTAIESHKRAIKFKFPKAKNVSNGQLCVLGVPDLHIGKLAWSPETGHGNYDCHIAKLVWEDAITDLLSRAPDCEECWLPIGNDFFNVDNHARTTTNGTPQDEDGRWQKTYKLGCDMAIWAITQCRKRFPKVKVIIVGGNHDMERTYYLGDMLERLSQFMDGVEVDNRELDRKYFNWGEVGIGLAHGDRMKEKEIAQLFAYEAPQIWGITKRREMLYGHVHHSVVKDMGGVIARWLPALCPPDHWHSKSGYAMAEKAATLLVYNKRSFRTQEHYSPEESLFS